MDYLKIPISEFTEMFQQLHFEKNNTHFYQLWDTWAGSDWGSTSFLPKNYHKEPFLPATSNGKQRSSLDHAISIESPTFKTKIKKVPHGCVSSDLLWPRKARLPLQMKWRRRDCRRLHVKPETIITVTQAESSRHRRRLRRLKPACERASERLFRWTLHRLPVF